MLEPVQPTVALEVRPRLVLTVAHGRVTDARLHCTPAEITLSDGAAGTSEELAADARTIACASFSRPELCTAIEHLVCADPTSIIASVTIVRPDDDGQAIALARCAGHENLDAGGTPFRAACEALAPIVPEADS
jgi:hypothetical protein